MSSITRSEFLKLVAGSSLGLFFFSSCENVLQEKTFSQVVPSNVLNTKDGIISVLASAYGHANLRQKPYIRNCNEWTTDLSWETGGAVNSVAVLFINFKWDSSQANFNILYNDFYKAILDTNTILDNKEKMNKNLDKDKVKELIAEARFVRALSYQYLYKLFGPIPLRTSNNEKKELPRASEKEMKNFLESEYNAIIPLLPHPGGEVKYGRATNGAARGYLCKFYLNTKQWKKAAQIAKDIIDMDYYQLFPSFKDMLKVSNEGNKEMIWVFPKVSKGPGLKANNLPNAIFPPKFEKWPRTGLTMQSNWNNWAAQDRLRDAFYKSFNSKDKRLEPIMTEYVNKAGKTINLLNNKDDTRAFRYWPDPDAQGNFHGNDVPGVRYADILMTRAEALNELNGPNKESISLINQVRKRAGLDNISLIDFSSKSKLRDHILKERGWEFYQEGKRRVDLIRMGKFIDYAHSRGISHADSHHRRFPIPQAAIDANPELKQNPGY